MNNTLKSKVFIIAMSLILFIGFIPATEVFAVPAPTPISTVSVNDLDLPVYGEQIDTEVTLPENCHYHIATPDEMKKMDFDDASSIFWFDNDAYNSMTPSAKFDNDKENNYYSGFILMPDDGYFFARETTATINGMSDIVDAVYSGVSENDPYYRLFSINLTAIHLRDFEIQMPFTLNVENLGTELPGKETFKFEATDVEGTKVPLTEDSITVENLKFTDNKASVEGMVNIKVKGDEAFGLLSDGIYLKMTPGNTDGWKYASEEWYLLPLDPFGPLSNVPLEPVVVGVDAYSVKGEQISEALSDEIIFNVSYKIDKAPVTPDKPEAPVTPDKPEAPKTKAPATGDTNNMIPWMLLLLGAAGTTVAVRMKKER